ncbi:hypothetical protein O9H85_13595 [Paenibacillus filicis]|uniref:Uncharacterized protein n=2 Tax=Paenibacillus gyeongsangnamensis TaxID=3388067 RepID=A0ABT4Q9U2_9BACL|nr:CBO0543 family protein [Paenibacillus filicis]MCZ8513445.1 hypothetical protein [Paenibacillus filicis]
MLYMVSGNLLYFVLTSRYELWAFEPDFPIYPVLNEMFYTLIVFPCTALLFLHHFPERRMGRTKRYVKWIAIYAAVELLFAMTGRIVYDHGWNWYWSFAFDCMMFPMLRLHYIRAGYAYAVSAVIIVILLLWFKVPLQNVMTMDFQS